MAVALLRLQKGRRKILCEGTPLALPAHGLRPRYPWVAVAFVSIEIRQASGLPDVADVEAGAFFADEAGIAATVHDRAAVADAGATAHRRLEQHLHGLAAAGALMALVRV